MCPEIAQQILGTCRAEILILDYVDAQLNTVLLRWVEAATCAIQSF